MSRLYYLGHDGFILIHDEISIVMDYWSENSKAFEGSWSRHETDSLNIELTNRVLSANYVWVSHEHGDHFDPTYIARLKPPTQILIPRFIDRNLYEKIKSINPLIDIKEISENCNLRLSSSLLLKCILEKPTYTCHGSLLLKTNEKYILHNGDTTINDLFLDTLECTNVDIFLGQYISPSPFPWNIISFSTAEKKKLYKAIAKSYLKHFTFCCESLNAKHAIPCAGPASIDSGLVDIPVDILEEMYNKSAHIDQLRNYCRNTLIHDLKVSDFLEI